MAEAIYIPANPALTRALSRLPPELRRYREHAQFLLHTIATKRWLNDVDEKGYARLRSTILRRYVPNAVLGPLKAHLADIGAIQTAHYSAGHYPTGYRIGPGYDGQPRRVILVDPLLIRKRRAWREAYSPPEKPGPETIIRQRVRILEHMRGSLDRLGLAKPVDGILRELARTDVDPDHALYVCETIHHGDHAGLKVDAFGWRVHSIVTRTNRRIRDYLTIDGKPLIEFDVRNAQPLMLAMALRSPQAWTTYIACGHHIGEGRRGAGPVVLPLVDAEEVGRFTQLCERGVLYEFLMAEGNLADRERAKRLLFRDVLFGEPCVNGPVTKVFAREWPTCLEAVRVLKRRHGYKIVAKILQRLESAIIIDGVCGRLVREHPEVRFLTIHDSAMVVADSAETVGRVMWEEFAKYGVVAKVQEEKRGKSGEKSYFSLDSQCGRC